MRCDAYVSSLVSVSRLVFRAGVLSDYGWGSSEGRGRPPRARLYRTFARITGYIIIRYRSWTLPREARRRATIRMPCPTLDVVTDTDGVGKPAGMQTRGGHQASQSHTRRTQNRITQTRSELPSREQCTRINPQNHNTARSGLRASRLACPGASSICYRWTWPFTMVASS